MTSILTYLLHPTLTHIFYLACFIPVIYLTSDLAGTIADLYHEYKEKHRHV